LNILTIVDAFLLFIVFILDISLQISHSLVKNECAGFIFEKILLTSPIEFVANISNYGMVLNDSCLGLFH